MYVCLYTYLFAFLRRRSPLGERGQASAEYALVLLGAAAIAILLVAWATKTDMIEKLLDFVLERIKGKAEDAG